MAAIASSSTTCETSSYLGSRGESWTSSPRTSILQRLNGGFCDAVLEREGSARILRRLSRANLLLVPLDHKDEEYRYHSLASGDARFRAPTPGRRDISPSCTARASHWYAAQGDMDHAVTHAISSGDVDEAGA